MTKRELLMNRRGSIKKRAMSMLERIQASRQEGALLTSLLSACFVVFFRYSLVLEPGQERVN